MVELPNSDGDSNVYLYNSYTDDDTQASINIKRSFFNNISVVGLNPFADYKDRIRRRLYWHIVAKRKGLDSYGAFKPYWDPNIDVSSEIKNEFILYKHTIKRLIKVSIGRHN